MKKDYVISTKISLEDYEASKKALRKLGMPVSQAIRIFLSEVCATGSIPFEIKRLDFEIKDEIEGSIISK